MMWLHCGFLTLGKAELFLEGSQVEPGTNQNQLQVHLGRNEEFEREKSSRPPTMTCWVGLLCQYCTSPFCMKATETVDQGFHCCFTTELAREVVKVPNKRLLQK